MSFAPQTYPVQQGVQFNLPPGAIFDKNMRATSSGGAACSVALAANTTKPNCLLAIYYSYDTTPTGGSVTISDGTDTVFKVAVAAAGPGYIPFPLPMGTPQAHLSGDLTVTLASGGGSVVGELNLIAFVFP